MLSIAVHDVLDCRMSTPEDIARQARNYDFATFLVNWPVAKLKYLDFKFVQEWGGGIPRP